MDNIKELRDSLKLYALITTIAILLSLLTGISMLYIAASTILAGKMLWLFFGFGLMFAFAIYGAILLVKHFKSQPQMTNTKKKKLKNSSQKTKKQVVVEDEEYEEDDEEDEDDEDFDYDDDDE